MRTYKCLYTRHLTQKRKQWLDGKLTVYANHKVQLKDEFNALIDEQFLRSENLDVGKMLQIGRVLVDIIELVYEKDEKPKAAEIERNINDYRSSKRKLLSSLSTPKLKINSKFRPNLLNNSLSEVLKTAVVEPIKPHELRGKHFYKKPAVFSETAKDFKPAVDLNEQSCQKQKDADVDLYSRFDEIYEFNESNELVELNRAPDTNECKPLATNYQALCSPPSSPISDSLSLASSDVEVVSVEPSKKNAMFSYIPENLPSTGPWTKEAYVLFSFHPPKSSIKLEEV